MSEFVKYMFEDGSIQEARVQKHDGELVIEFSSKENKSYIKWSELLDMLTLLNQKEEQIKTQLKRDEK